METKKELTCEEAKAIVFRYYATMSGAEIARKYGMTANRVNSIAYRHGLRHDAATWSRMAREGAERLRQVRKLRDPMSHVRKWKATFRRDELRVMSGEPQVTGFLFREMPLRASKARYNLLRNRGYKEDPEDLWTLRYDGGTRRSPKMKNRYYGSERYYAERYHFAFKAAE